MKKFTKNVDEYFEDKMKSAETFKKSRKSFGEIFENFKRFFTLT